MFGLGLSEILLIAVVAIVVIGPKRLPEVARALGKGYAEFKKAMDGFKEAVNIDEVIHDKPKDNDLKNVYEDKWKTAHSEQSKDSPTNTETAKNETKETK
ncbi:MULTISPECIES: twin-arginine translocase TatA/TatE family subunit [Calditerrivibrio]|uniref:Sec-independent protein translocase protein TatA n=1 Tax=Calditerrivibrio nitroreducens TaxID=477976 RepID=A0A2J6WGL2_9BACT|nr:MAG: Sec-independent protein translocase TatA [Calditerrivibrio nitroreducens]